MHVIARLKNHYANQAPALSFGGSEGESLRTRTYQKLPEELMREFLGNGVWYGHRKALSDTLVLDGYCVVDACLDSSGTKTPNKLPLPPEMLDHDLQILVYVDMIGRIRMRAVGGFTKR